MYISHTQICCKVTGLRAPRITSHSEVVCALLDGVFLRILDVAFMHILDIAFVHIYSHMKCCILDIYICL